jgi:YggT family protein
MNILVIYTIKALDIYLWIVIASVMVSWLVAFDVINIRNQWARKFCDLLNRATEPVMSRLRKVIPPIGGMDLTPMVLMFGIYFLQSILIKLL